MRGSGGALLLLVALMSYLIELSADSMTNEGFLNAERNVDRPNLPFATDTNRYSDGFTSTSASGEVSSPHFPIYVGALGNTSDRFTRFASYMEDAAVQGLAGVGAGEATQEDAKVLILNELASNPNLPAPVKNFTVFAAIKWNPSDFAVQEGETYRIDVFGDQYWYDGGIQVDAYGYEAYYDAVSACYIGLGRCRSHLKKKRRLADSNWMALVCSIGEFVQPAEEVEAGKEAGGKYLPLDESTLGETIFEVGKGVEFYAEYTGQLICFANDAHTLYWNNQGTIEVTATRVSWPPTSEVYYQHLYLPACDSAMVVYVNKGVNDNDDPSKIACNPTGGGSGWPYENIIARSADYSTGAPEFITEKNSTYA